MHKIKILDLLKKWIYGSVHYKLYCTSYRLTLPPMSRLVRIPSILITGFSDIMQLDTFEDMTFILDENEHL